MQDNKVMIDWLHRRKISDTVISEFNIHWGKHPTIGECIVIPVVEGGFNKYRRNPLSSDTPKYVYDKGGKVCLYGIEKAIHHTRILITEGELDTLVAWSHNIPSVSSTGGALSFQKEWADFFENKEVILCFDNDEAGGAGMAKALEIVPWAKILLLPDRPGVKDISDYCAAGGDLHALMSTARTFSNIEDVISDRADRVATWKSVNFHDAYIKLHTKPTYAPRTVGSSDELTRAKQKPIHEFMDFNYQGNAICLFHSEKTPSLHYYPKTNSCYCFGGCGKAYDSIDIYMKKFGLTFKEAIKEMK